ncbi:MAG TPA: hypothetical protein VJX70_07830 [Candidatus Acidoferrum sp.]|nr:hypothetical protein [Candidatus Acidoferrum sp.]
MRKLASLALSLFLLSGTAFADSPKDTPKDSPKEAAQPAKTAAAKATTKTNAEIAAEMEELRQALQVQQEQLQMLKEELSKRDRQIEEAREAAASANARAAEANTKAAEAVTTSTEVKSTATALNSTVASMAASNAAVVNSTVATSGSQQAMAEDKGPMTIRFKGINITPGGFIAAETVNRQHATGDDINTQFTGIPYNGNSMSKVSEMAFAARQSRLSLLLETKLASAKVTGYFETDFLGAGVTSNNRESNSYVLRMRQGWGRVDLDNGWSFSAGQMWTLATENKKGIVNRQELFPMMIDPQYIVGFTWERAYSARVTKSFGDKFTAAASIEGPQTTIGGNGFSTFTSTSATGAVTTYQNFFFNTVGFAQGLNNAFDTTGYTANKLPDFLIKGALDPGWGHYEVFGIVSEFRSRVYPCAVIGTTAANIPTPVAPTVLGCTASASFNPTTPGVGAAGAYNDSRTGGGFGVSASAPLFSKKLDVGIKGVYGSGIGRFGSAQLADVTARPNGTLAPIKNAQWLAKLEWHVTPKFDVYGYLGGEYDARTSYTGYQSVKLTTTAAIPGCGNPAVIGQPACGGGAPPGTIQYPVGAQTTTTISTTGSGGYGSQANNNTGCNIEIPGGVNSPLIPGSGISTGTPGAGGTCAGGSSVRYVGEGTLGFWNRIYQGEKGRLQWGIQYSYLFKVGWSGGGDSTIGIAPKAIDNMVFTSFRYYLP